MLCLRKSEIVKQINKYNLRNLIKQGVSEKEHWKGDYVQKNKIKKRMPHKPTLRSKTLGGEKYGKKILKNEL